MKNTTLLIISYLLFSAVSYSQTKEGKAVNLQSYESVGFGLSEFDTLNLRLLPEYIQYFVPSIVNNLHQFGVKEPSFYSDLFRYQTVDKKAIINKCKENDLEGFI